jgi:hypothetical protein
MPETVWVVKNKSIYTPSKCELLGICHCEKDNVKCGAKIIGKDNQSKNKVKE